MTKQEEHLSLSPPCHSSTSQSGYALRSCYIMEVGAAKRRVPPMPKFKPPPLPQKKIGERESPIRDILGENRISPTPENEKQPVSNGSPKQLPWVQERKRRDINGNSGLERKSDLFKNNSVQRQSEEKLDKRNVSNITMVGPHKSSNGEEKLKPSINGDDKPCDAAVAKTTTSGCNFSSVTKLDDSLYLSQGSVRSQRLAELKISLIVNVLADEEESPIDMAESFVPTSSCVLNDSRNSAGESLDRSLELLSRLAEETGSGGVVLVVGRDSFSTALMCIAYFVLHENTTVEYGLVMLRLKWPKANLPEDKLRKRLQEMSGKKTLNDRTAAAANPPTKNKTLLKKLSEMNWRKYFGIAIFFLVILAGVMKMSTIVLMF